MKQIFKFLAPYQLYLWPAMAIILVVLMFVYVIAPQTGKLIHASGTISETSKKAKALEAKASSLELLDEESLRNNLTLSLNVLPPEKDLISALNQIQFLTNSFSLTIKDIGFSNSSSQESDNFLIHLSVEGTLAQVQGFSGVIKKAPILMTVESIDLSSTDLVTYSLLIGVKSYFLPLTSMIGSVESPVVSLTDKQSALIAKIKDQLKEIPPLVDDESSIDNVVSKKDPFN